MNNSFSTFCGCIHIVVLHGIYDSMTLNPLPQDVVEDVNVLLSHAKESAEIVPERVKESVIEIIDALELYLESDEEPWPSWRLNVPWEYVRNEYASRLGMWKKNTFVAFQNDDSPKKTMIERAVLTLLEGGFDASLIDGEVGIHVKSRDDDAILYLDAHFLAHPYSAIKMNNGAVLFTVLDSRHYPAENYERTDWGTTVLSIDDLKKGIETISSQYGGYANNLNQMIGE